MSSRKSLIHIFSIVTKTKLKPDSNSCYYRILRCLIHGLLTLIKKNSIPNALYDLWDGGHSLAPFQKIFLINSMVLLNILSLFTRLINMVRNSLFPFTSVGNKKFPRFWSRVMQRKTVSLFAISLSSGGIDFLIPRRDW